jgi:hypothetical protein
LCFWWSFFDCVLFCLLLLLLLLLFDFLSP